MADYGADPGGFKSASYGMSNEAFHARYNTTPTQFQLEARLKELELEVRKLKGIKTYRVDVPVYYTYYVDATDEKEALDQWESVKYSEQRRGTPEVKEET